MTKLFRKNTQVQDKEKIESTEQFITYCLDDISELSQSMKGCTESHKVENTVSDIIELCGEILKEKHISTKHFFAELEKKAAEQGRFSKEFSTKDNSTEE